MKNKTDIERNIGICMRVGVVIAAALMVFGFVLLLINFQQYFSGFKDFSFEQILVGLLELNPYSYMLVGIFVLILTPIIRVVSSIILFIKEKNILYSLITTIVFAILILSFIVALIIG